MIIIKKKESTFYVKEESIIWEYNKQYSSFNVYALQNRKRFRDFKEELLNSSYEEFDSVNDVYSLALKYKLVSTVAHKPNI